MKKFLSLLLAMILVLSMVACGNSKKNDDDDDDDSYGGKTSASEIVSSKKTFYDYIVANGEYYDGDYFLSDTFYSDGSEFSFSFIASDDKSLNLYCTITSDEYSTSSLLSRKAGESTYSAFVTTEISGTEYSAIATVYPSSFNKNTESFSDFYSEAPSSIHESLNGLLASTTKVNISCAKLVLEEEGFTLSDIGFTNY